MMQALKFCNEDSLAELEAEESRLLTKLYRASSYEIAAILGKLLLHYSLGNALTESQQQSLFEDYIEDLGEYPADVILQSTKDYRRDPSSQFFPKVGDLRARCEAKIANDKRKLARIKHLIKSIRNETVQNIQRERDRGQHDFKSLIERLKAGAASHV